MITYVDLSELTRWGRDKMTATFVGDIFKGIFFIENVKILIRISPRFVPGCLIDHRSELHGLDNGLALIRRQAII